MSSAQARALFAGERVARLATVDGRGAPHVVPVTFAVIGDRIFFAVDHKAKSTTALRRLSNIESDHRVSLLADHYREEWRELWWARADGTASILRAAEGDDERAQGIAALCAKYPQYRDRPPQGDVVLTAVSRWSGWSAGDAASLR